jgi:hypothetical protein
LTKKEYEKIIENTFSGQVKLLRQELFKIKQLILNYINKIIRGIR